MSEKRELTDLERLGEFLEGTCTSVISALECLGIEEGPDWEDELLNINIECCVVCAHWHESCMLEFDEARNGGVCDPCREDA